MENTTINCFVSPFLIETKTATINKPIYLIDYSTKNKLEHFLAEMI